jgi:flagellum-specific ATP synthase
MDDLPLTYAAADGWSRTGSVIGASERSVLVDMPGLSPGTAVFVDRAGAGSLATEVVAVEARIATCAPLGSTRGVVPGASASSSLARIGAFVGRSLLGRSVDAWGRGGPPRSARAVRTDAAPIPLDDRVRVRKALRTGVASIDAFVPIGLGQRVALFAGAGVGKTALLRRIVDAAHVDARVIALVGERGREAAEIVSAFRSTDRWKTTTVVCATAETSAAERLAAAKTATAQAEELAISGLDVLLVVDSLTRVASAWREIAFAAGDPAAHRGHPASLAPALAAMVERAGARRRGSITAVYAVLVEGDDLREPVTDTVRALLDGHIVLSRALAEAGRFPAIDVLRSLSRLTGDIVSEAHQRDAADVRRAMAALERAEDLFAIGAYERGGDPQLDAAVDVRRYIERLLYESDDDACGYDPIAALATIAAALRAVD